MFGHSLPGLFTPTDAWKGPDYLSHMPQVVRWLASVFEYRAFEGIDIPYTIDQHNLIPVGSCPHSTCGHLRSAWAAFRPARAGAIHVARDFHPELCAARPNTLVRSAAPRIVHCLYTEFK